MGDPAPRWFPVLLLWREPIPRKTELLIQPMNPAQPWEAWTGLGSHKATLTAQYKCEGLSAASFPVHRGDPTRMAPNQGTLPLQLCYHHAKVATCFNEGRTSQSLTSLKISLTSLKISLTNLTRVQYSLIVHPLPPGMHIAIDSLLQVLSFELDFFVCRHVSI